MVTIEGVVPNRGNVVAEKLLLLVVIYIVCVCLTACFKLAGYSESSVHYLDYVYACMSIFLCYHGNVCVNVAEGAT